jgi:hypothetical protein
VLLAGVGLVDTGLALHVADGLMRTQQPADLQEALCLLAGQAVRAGLGDELLARARRDGFVTEQATWAVAAAAGGALDPIAAQRLADELAPRVLDELDPGRELVAGLPLLVALAHSGSGELCAELALAWRVPPPLLAQQLLVSAAAGAQGLRGRDQLDALLAMGEQAWAPTYHWAYGWWRAAGDDPAQRRAALDDVLALAAEPPWDVAPGSLRSILLTAGG